MPDMLSRLDMEGITVETPLLLDFNSEEFKSEKYLSLIDTIEQDRDKLPDLKVHEGIVYKRVKFHTVEVENEEDCWRIWLPEKLTEGIIRKSHEDNTTHGGIAKTLYNIREYFYWPCMAKEIKEYIVSLI